MGWEVIPVVTSSPSLHGLVSVNIETINALRDFLLLKRLVLPDSADQRLATVLQDPGALAEVRVWLDAFRDSLVLIDDFVRASVRQTPTTHAYREVAEATTRMLDALVDALTAG